MSSVELGNFTTSDGLTGTVLADHTVEEQSSVHVTLRCADGRELKVDKDVLRAQDDRTWLLPVTSDEFASLLRAPVNSSAVVIPIVQEQLNTTVKQFISGTIRVSTHTTSRQETVNTPLTQEHVEVQRVPVGRQIDKAIEPYQEGDTWVIPVLEEVLVVEKRLMLREEIRLTTRRSITQSSETVTLRGTEATVERILGDGKTVKTGER